MKTAKIPKAKRARAAGPESDAKSGAPTAEESTHKRLSVVGIGASAGGLEPLEQFFQNVEPTGTLAFVVVQHLDPTHKGMLADILRRTSALPVSEIAEGMRVVADHVYVIPPNKNLSIVNGTLRLTPPEARRGFRLPIDFFLRSLAEDLGPLSIGVLLSGMGSDGTSGFRAIRDAAGATFAQEPASAKFDAMPRSAIDDGLADVVAKPNELPSRIIDYIARPRRANLAERPEPDAKLLGGLDRIVGLLRSATRHDFSEYKSSTVIRRIERRMALHQLDDIEDYARYLGENPSEAEILFKELLIGVTAFFRDPLAWERLKADVLTPLVSTSLRSPPARAWVTACSTGEEAYTLAMAFREVVDEVGKDSKVSLQIFATDLDPEAIRKARIGAYPIGSTADVSAARVDRFFVDEGRSLRVRDEIRRMVVFATQNVISDPPFTRLDLVTCRNLLIYLDPELQNRLIRLFHYTLNDDGALFLGSAETVGSHSQLFTATDTKSRIYKKQATPLGAPLEAPSSLIRSLDRPNETFPTRIASSAPSVEAIAERILLQRFGPAAVLVGPSGDVLYLGGRAGVYLELPYGKANWNIFAMALPELRQALTTAFRKALATKTAIVVPRVAVGPTTKGVVVDLVLQRIDEPAQLRGAVMIVFVEANNASDGAGSPRTKGKRPSATKDVRGGLRFEALESELHATREDMQRSQAELTSGNEELQSMNEELQSANEELTTSKEELQSMNEELQTLNHELQAKVDDFSRASNDMKNLLDSTEIAILFLDDALNIRRFTPQAALLIRLIPGDIGRPLADLASMVEYPSLEDDAREVQRTLAFRERTVATRDGRSFGVRIMPYRTADNRVDGLVITFTRLPATTAPKAKEPS